MIVNVGTFKKYSTSDRDIFDYREIIGARKIVRAMEKCDFEITSTYSSGDKKYKPMIIGDGKGISGENALESIKTTIEDTIESLRPFLPEKYDFEKIPFDIRYKKRGIFSYLNHVILNANLMVKEEEGYECLIEVKERLSSKLLLEKLMRNCYLASVNTRFL